MTRSKAAISRLADVRRLVLERIEFIVVDKKNSADITRSILLQVIADKST